MVATFYLLIATFRYQTAKLLVIEWTLAKVVTLSNYLYVL